MFSLSKDIWTLNSISQFWRQSKEEWLLKLIFIPPASFTSEGQPETFKNKNNTCFQELLSGKMNHNLMIQGQLQPDHA